MKRKEKKSECPKSLEGVLDVSDLASDALPSEIMLILSQRRSLGVGTRAGIVEGFCYSQQTRAAKSSSG